MLRMVRQREDDRSNLSDMHWSSGPLIKPLYYWQFLTQILLAASEEDDQIQSADRGHQYIVPVHTWKSFHALIVRLAAHHSSEEEVRNKLPPGVLLPGKSRTSHADKRRVFL